ncbi:MAG TPA: EXLDI protein [Ktedonobacterales bacterium]|jgi:EXLDI family protein|nr:EXLDI protein [Ktedonobacterales bacterium]
MPQKMIYVADADWPVFERAQQLAETTLSATIARAMRQFVAAENAKRADLRAVTVTVSQADQATERKRFRGRLLARHREHTPDDELRVRIVYLTARGQFAVYTKTIAHWSSYATAGWKDWDWSTMEYQLYVCENLDALRRHVGEALYAAVERKLDGDAADVEVLAI